jgi:hypothetical protein
MFGHLEEPAMYYTCKTQGILKLTHDSVLAYCTLSSVHLFRTWDFENLQHAFDHSLQHVQQAAQLCRACHD